MRDTVLDDGTPRDRARDPEHGKPRSIPVIDVRPALAGDADAVAAIVREIDAACRHVGFFVVVGHGVDDRLVSEVREVATAFFELDDETKLAYEADPGGEHGGYVGSEALSYSRGDASPPDLKETFTVRRADVVPQGDTDVVTDVASDVEDVRTSRWPREVPRFEAVATAYFQALEALASEVMRLFARALDLPAEHFDAMIDRSISAVRMLHYPAIDDDPLPGQLRAGAHTDFGSLTLLLTDDAPGGLQVLTGGAWIDVPHVPGAFVVNIGDLMARWTNDRWTSTMHRVVTPPVGPGTRRLSVAFFHQPNADVVIEALPTCLAPGETALYPPVTSGAHLREKVVKQRAMGNPVT